MKASDLHLLDLLEINPSQGSIRFKDRRMLLWDADAFGNLRKELIACVGLEQARPILKRFGFANGYRDARMTQDLLQWDNDSEWWRSCPALQRHEGKAQPKVTHLNVNREGGVFEMEVDWTQSYEAEQHRRIFGKADAPVCWTLAGFASGFATALMGEECIVVETECAAMGGERCRVIGKTRRAWGGNGEAFASDYKAQPVASELEARESELREQQAQLSLRERALEQLQQRATPSRELMTRSHRMEDVLSLCETAAKVESTVLITGECGVGKSHIARYIHDQSGQSTGPFSSINCGALPETLLDSELFGHLKDSFIGASSDKLGVFEAANGGTLFLDEVAALSPASQVKLLRVLQEREVWPVGSNEPRKINVRVLASTSRDLEQLVRDGKFRRDLYYRLNLVVVEVPPLRARREDILPLARLFLSNAAERAGQAVKTLTSEAAEALTDHLWPGNIRELESAIERALILATGKNMIQREQLSPSIRSVEANIAKVKYDEVMPMAEIERRYVLEVLERYNGNRTRTAKALGIGANTLWRKLKGWGVPPARGEASY